MVAKGATGSGDGSGGCAALDCCGCFTGGPVKAPDPENDPDRGVTDIPFLLAVSIAVCDDAPWSVEYVALSEAA